MKIPRALPQCDDGTLLAVLGHYHGVLYMCRDGEITKVDEVLIEEEHYDKEGMFKSGGTKNAYTYGSVVEPKTKEVEKEFFRVVAKRVYELVQSEGIKAVYLYRPSECAHYIDSDWRPEMQKLIEHTFDGNYTKSKPLELLEMVQKAREEAQIDINQPTGEAKDILDKTDQ